MRDDTSTFHAGERALQAQAGVAERLHRLGPQLIRDHLSDQHRDFFALLPFLIVGSIDRRGQPTASLLAGPPGFVSSPEPERLRIDALPPQDDPLHENASPGAPIALLGIQPHTRRRNRANGRVLRRDARGFELDVSQSFGNCPKYIQPREVLYTGPRAPRAASVSAVLGRAERELLQRADTFYIASAHPEARTAPAASHGLDVSHRGGPPGFVQVTDDATFSVPDFRGNQFFNTLGNLSLHSAAGLLFIDVASGDVLELEVSAQALAGAHPFAGPQATGRIVRFVVRQARKFAAGAPLRFIEPASAAAGPPRGE